MTEANFGWLIRSVHRWSASMIVLMMILHVFRVYLTGGFKKPREIIIFFSLLYGIYTSIFMYDTFYSIPSSNVYIHLSIISGGFTFQKLVRNQ